MVMLPAAGRLHAGKWSQESTFHPQRSMLLLQVLSELLSQHILQNYDKFVAGIDSVSNIESELRTALDVVRTGRADLSHLKEASNTDVCIAKGAARKARSLNTLDILQKLKATRDLPRLLRYAQCRRPTACELGV